MDSELKNVRVRSFRDLKVWQKAMDLTLVIYRVTQGFPQNETFGLTSQLKRCSVSIPSNIAEGQGRSNTREFGQFLGIARGSNCELQTQWKLLADWDSGTRSCWTRPRDFRTKSAR